LRRTELIAPLIWLERAFIELEVVLDCELFGRVERRALSCAVAVGVLSPQWSPHDRAREGDSDGDGEV
jgi:hypothetical protein